MKIKCSTPSKIILTGEHSVVEGYSAISASINFQTTSTISINLKNSENSKISEKNKILKNRFELIVNFKCPKTGRISVIWETDLFNLALEKIDENILFYSRESVLKNLEKRSFSLFTKPLIHLAQQSNFLSLVEIKTDKIDAIIVEKIRILIFILAAYFKLTKFNILCTINSEIPIRGGLGSSASLSASLVGAMMVAAENLNITNNKKINVSICNNDNINVQNRKNCEDLKIINRIALECEKISHGHPSGIDNETVVFGGLNLFKEHKIQRQINSSFFEKFGVLIIDTDVVRCTKKLIEKVEKAKLGLSNTGKQIFKAMGSVTDDFLDVLNNTENQTLTNVRNILRTNQKFLECLDASHPNVNLIIAICNRYNTEAKITGAGGGGTVICLFSKKETKIDALKSELFKNGFKNYIAEFTTKGLSIEIQ